MSILGDLKSVERVNVSTMASAFDFVNESANSPLNDFWMELFQSESSDDEFDGFNEDDCHFGLKSNVILLQSIYDQLSFVLRVNKTRAWVTSFKRTYLFFQRLFTSFLFFFCYIK